MSLFNWFSSLDSRCWNVFGKWFKVLWKYCDYFKGLITHFRIYLNTTFTYLYVCKYYIYVCASMAGQSCGSQRKGEEVGSPLSQGFQTWCQVHVSTEIHLWVQFKLLMSHYSWNFLNDIHRHFLCEHKQI